MVTSLEFRLADQDLEVLMTSFDYKYQNALGQAIVFGIFSFVKNRSCVTQICITKVAAKCILVLVTTSCIPIIVRPIV